MNALGLVLAVKIIVTIIFVAVPFLLLPQEKLRARFRTEGAGSGTLFRLYGVAMLAILANYAYGLWAAMYGQFPWGVIAMGVISNGGAVLVSLWMGAWRHAKALNAFFAAVAIALLLAALFQRQALTPLW
jgi:hypothetical protein